MESDVISGSFGGPSKYTPRSFATDYDIRKLLQFYSDHAGNGKNLPPYNIFPGASKKWVLEVEKELITSGLLGYDGNLTDFGAAFINGDNGHKKSLSAADSKTVGSGEYSFEKREHGGVMIVYDALHIDVIMRSQSVVPKNARLDSEFVTTMMLKYVPEATVVDLDVFFVSRMGTPDNHHRMRALIPERGLFDYKHHTLTEACKTMLDFAEQKLFDSSILDIKNCDAHQVSLGGVGPVRVPPKKYLRDQIDNFKAYLSTKKECSKKPRPKTAGTYAPKFTPEGDAEHILRLELVTGDKSDRKVFLAGGKLTPLGAEFYRYCCAESPFSDEKQKEDAYRLYAVLNTDGNLTKIGADVLSILAEKAK